MAREGFLSNVGHLMFNDACVQQSKMQKVCTDHEHLTCAVYQYAARPPTVVPADLTFYTLQKQAYRRSCTIWGHCTVAVMFHNAQQGRKTHHTQRLNHANITDHGSCCYDVVNAVAIAPHRCSGKESMGAPAAE